MKMCFGLCEHVRPRAPCTECVRVPFLERGGIEGPLDVRDGVIPSHHNRRRQYHRSSYSAPYAGIAQGRGACESAGLQPGAVDIITASLGNALGSVGGFCAGTHQASLNSHRELVGSEQPSGV